MSKTVNGIVVGIIVMIVVITVFAMRGCEGETKGERDEKNRISDSVRAAVTAEMKDTLAASETRNIFITNELNAIRIERNAARQRNAELRERLATLEDRPGGGAVLPPRPDQPDDTAEVVGPRTRALMNDLAAENVRLLGIVARDTVVQDSMQRDIASLQAAVKRGIDALIDSEKEVRRLKADRYGWKDRITVGPNYGLQARKNDDGDWKMSNGWGVSVQYAAVRPLRHLPSLPRWLGGNPDG